MTDLHPRLQELQAKLAVSPLTRINDPELTERQLELWIKRDDLLHPIISGNKWRKLKYILNHALHGGADCIVSMGGAYSNHLHALAFTGKALGLKTIGYIRGERPSQLNATLHDLLDWGMELRFVSRGEYRQLRDYHDYDSLPGLQPGQYWLPEGGATDLALQGVAELVDEIEINFDTLAVACGTGTTLAGLLASPLTRLAIGVAALKGGDFLIDDVQQLLNKQGMTSQADWRILVNYHFGGFAKTTPALLAFMQDFQLRHDIELEPVYTGKLLFALYGLIRKGYFPAGQRIVAVHTGGLQGKRN
ncbi:MULTISPECIES: 1-aminocyclopropane-1-carboxylate deaminase/D-cysteine desulfhydrase [Methylomonas]|uniref:1-aminocyclopropane-1-carboxylate deaminase n=1 Tax=Methylomonas methanica TaxID=421 RepID=A0ABY2CRQ7_METMH|nr:MULTISPECIES: pyridoxal-phosphate dependent enzyme [Methylomonas]TCV87710.1 1-aminocyclopropane-1-carboxylate deaminase [Methylomonas methanica]